MWKRGNCCSVSKAGKEESQMPDFKLGSARKDCLFGFAVGL